MTMEPTQRRGPHQFIYEILKKVSQPIKKTKLMYGINIGHMTLSRFMPLLLERGLVKDIPYVSAKGKRLSKKTPYLFVITDEGKALVRLYDRIYDILGWRLRNEGS